MKSGPLCLGSIWSLMLAWAGLTTDAASTPALQPTDNTSSSLSGETVGQMIDSYLDRRWLPPDQARKATQELLARLREARLKPDGVELLLRARRMKYPATPPVGRLVLIKGLSCDQVDYATSCFLYVPKSYSVERSTPLLLVGHGGNGAMSIEYATQAALSGLMPWIPVVEKEGLILAAPLSERGWGPIGNAILVSLISRLQRSFHLDPDRIFVTGHSMGGHLSWRSGIYLGDRWGAVAPMSGGYDYVETKEVYPLINVAGYATYGREEPYNINRFNTKIKAWMADHGYDWQLVEKPGGHEIYNDELPKVAQFLLAHPRVLYRPSVFASGGKGVDFNTPGENEKWGHQHQWNPQRPIPCATAHWVRLFPLPEETPKERTKQRVWAENLGQNRVRITSQGARRVRIYLHPRMVDFNRAIEITANGRPVFKQKVGSSLETMVELVREFDDRGRIFHAAVDIDIPEDAIEVPEPRSGKR
jgi:hypothetical protein